jgi:hypothetical protein
MASIAKRLLSFDSQYGYATELNAGDTATAGIFQAIGVSGVAFDAQGSRGINLLAPQNPTDFANKAYVDGIAQGISAVPSVRVLANGNVTLSGTQTIDGVALAAGDRVLLTAQTNGVQNGVWIVASGNWTRPSVSDDYQTGTNATGRYVFVEEGTNYSSEGWLCVTSGGAVVDTTATKWTQFTGMGEITAGSGLVTSAVNGNTISVNLASNAGLTFTSGALGTLISGTGGLQSGASGLAVLVNGTSNTVATDASGLRTLGVPQSFTLGGVATSTNVTAANLATLTGGTTSLADPLHQHSNVLSAQTCAATHATGVSLNLGDPVYWSATANTLARGDASALASSQIIGLAAAAGSANSQVFIIKRGVAAGVLSGATPGQTYYLNAGGGLTTSLPSSGSIVRIGTACSSTALDVFPMYVGQRSSS